MYVLVQLRGLFSNIHHSWNDYILIFVKGGKQKLLWSSKLLSFHQVAYSISSILWKFRLDGKPTVAIQKWGYRVQSKTKGTRPFRCLDVMRTLSWPHNWILMCLFFMFPMNFIIFHNFRSIYIIQLTLLLI